VHFDAFALFDFLPHFNFKRSACRALSQAAEKATRQAEGLLYMARKRLILRCRPEAKHHGQACPGEGLQLSAPMATPALFLFQLLFHHPAK
jgi:hypothetical protein